MSNTPKQRQFRAPIILSALAVLLGTAAVAGADPGSQGAEIFAAARAAVANGRVVKTSQLGFTIEKKGFSELPADGAVLIGFEVGIARIGASEEIVGLRPIYLTSVGENSYQDYGSFRAADPFGPKNSVFRKLVSRRERVVARAGYAVGGISLRTSLSVLGMSVTYMRINGQTLDPQQSYSSDWIGDKNGQAHSVSGNGAPIVGVFGNQDDNKVLGLGLICLGDAAPAVSAARKPAQNPGAGAPAPTKQPRPIARRSPNGPTDKLKALVADLEKNDQADAPAKEAEKKEAPAPPAAQDKAAAQDEPAPAQNKTAKEDTDAAAQRPWLPWAILAGIAVPVCLICLALVGRRNPPADADAAVSPSSTSGGASTGAKLVGVLVLGVAGAGLGYHLATAKPDGPARFREFASSEGRFKVEMPGSPSEETVFAAGLSMTTYKLEESDGAYGIVYADIPMLRGAPSNLISQALDSAREGMMGNINGKVTGESKIRLDGKYPGREVRGRVPFRDGELKARMYLVKERVYMVMVLGVPSWVNSANAKRFLDSLEVTR